MTAVNYRVQIDRKIDQVDKAAWDDLSGERPFTTVYWLGLLEQVLQEYEPTYLQLWQGQQLVAGAICYPQRHFYLSAYLKNKILHKAASQVLAWLPPYACVLPHFLRSGLLLHPTTETAVWLPLLLAEIEKLSRRRWAPFTYLGNLSPELGAFSERRAFGTMPIIQDSYLDIVWDNFEDYLSHLKSKRRYLVRSYIKNAEEAGVTIQEVPLSSAFRPQIETLIRNVAEKHNNTFLYHPDFLQRADAYLQPETAHRLVCCLQGEPITCITLLCSKGVMAAKWNGMNYARTHETYAYHYMMIQIIKKAIDLGMRRVDLGPTSYVLKRQLGSHFEDRVAGLKVGIRPLNTVFQRIVAGKATQDAEGGNA